MAFEYVFWAAAYPANVARLTKLYGFTDDFELEDGIAHAHDYPDDAYFQMSPNLPDDTLLVDRLSNVSSLVLVSPRLRDFVAERVPAGQVEFLDTKVLDHKGRPLAERYSIVNALGQVPILDLPKCGVLEENDSGIDKLTSFAVLDAAVPRDRPVFRAERLARYLLVHRDLAKTIDAAGFTGNRWVETSDILDLDIPADLSDL